MLLQPKEFVHRKDVLIFQIGDGEKPSLSKGFIPPGRVLLCPRIKPRNHRIEAVSILIHRNPRLSHARYCKARDLVADAAISPRFLLFQQLSDQSAAGFPDLITVEFTAAVRISEETGVDSLAVGIGTAHGFYKKEPHINLQRLREVNEAVSIPLVLHGGTGVPAETVRNCIRGGIAKVNVGTQLHATYLEALRGQLKPETAPNVSDVMNAVKEAIRPVVRDWIYVCRAQNRY